MFQSWSNNNGGKLFVAQRVTSKTGDKEIKNEMRQCATMCDIFRLFVALSATYMRHCATNGEKWLRNVYNGVFELLSF